MIGGPDIAQLFQSLTNQRPGVELFALGNSKFPHSLQRAQELTGINWGRSDDAVVERLPYLQLTQDGPRFYPSAPYLITRAGAIFELRARNSPGVSPVMAPKQTNEQKRINCRMGISKIESF